MLFSVTWYGVLKATTLTCVLVSQYKRIMLFNRIFHTNTVPVYHFKRTTYNCGLALVDVFYISFIALTE